MQRPIRLLLAQFNIAALANLMPHQRTIFQSQVRHFKRATKLRIFAKICSKCAHFCQFLRISAHFCTYVLMHLNSFI